MEAIDYLALLEKYMAHVLLVEGTTFIDGMEPWAGFSKAEAELLARLKTKVEEAEIDSG